MKKVILYFVFIFFITFLVACSCVHEWEEATCTEPKTCKKCGKTEGSVLGHDESSLNLVKSDKVKAVEIYESKCTRCQKVFDSKTKIIDTFVKDGLINLSPVEFVDRLNSSFNNISGNSLISKAIKSNDDEVMIAIIDSKTEKLVGGYSILKNSKDSFKYSERNSAGIYGVVGMVYDKEFIANISFTTMLTLDPSISFDEAKTITSVAMANEYYEDKGIKYLMSMVNDEMYIIIQVDQGETL